MTSKRDRDPASCHDDASPQPHDSDVALAAALADGAGQKLLSLRNRIGFSDSRRLRDEGDQLAHQYLLEELVAFRPGDAVLSEEGRGQTSRYGTERLTADRVWIIDPLDGTREYSEEGRDDWAVHVALWERARGITAAAVALPAQGATLRSDQAPVPIEQRKHSVIRIAVSRTRPPVEAKSAAATLGAELVPMGSAGAKLAAVVTGKVDAYVHAGGQFEWDSAAPVGVALAGGWHASRLDGSKLVYNQPDPYLPDLVACRPDLATSLLEAIRESL
ncbi:3'(2'),5'-bisphosphate nucleotidase CysQ [Natronoglycomyces albus]|uniref:3'(2'),5-bisphosphonucleoside 3'(2')-phosphohydrolase n=1 Tax=Natronoglycomyces albus TaxID=2811108 RepID=A0A895XUE5_9ACTN|nr:3'(2'),5'-bisphosphate nucleotidase CysQ [Natronoglycomyces albus]QSB06146.1 3'(2'),5'-bisphosphate nucleotidase CysQ [Natronoglycomyces albus]